MLNMGKGLLAGKILPERINSRPAALERQNCDRDETTCERRNAHIRRLIFRWQTDDLHDALQIVSAIIFDFDSALFLAVMENHARPEILLETRLQMFKCTSVNRNER